MIKDSIKQKLMGGYNWIESKKQWRQLCRLNESIPLYYQDWYWDANCEEDDDWWVITYCVEDEIEAAFLFEYKKRKGLYFIESPWQVPASGIWLKSTIFKSIESEMNYKQKIADYVLDHLPDYDCFSMVFDRHWENWHPFYWHGFNARPYYTMVIHPCSVEELRRGISKSRRNRINKSVRKYVCKLNSASIDEYWSFFEKSYRNRKRSISFSKDQFEKLVCAAMEHNAAEIRTVYLEGEMVAENIVFKDRFRSYHHFVTQMDDSDKDASTYAVYDSIVSAMESGREYDFEGSMIYGVCMFNLSFSPKFELQNRIVSESRKYRVMNGVRSVLSAVSG